MFLNCHSIGVLHSTESNHGDLLITRIHKWTQSHLEFRQYCQVEFLFKFFEDGTDIGYFLKLCQKLSSKKTRLFGRPGRSMNFWSDCAFKHPNYQYWLARSCPDHSRSPWTDGHFEASVSFGSSFEWRRGTVRRRLIGDDAKCKFALRRKWVNQLARLQSEVHQLKWGPTTTKRQRGQPGHWHRV